MVPIAVSMRCDTSEASGQATTHSIDHFAEEVSTGLTTRDSRGRLGDGPGPEPEVAQAVVVGVAVALCRASPSGLSGSLVICDLLAICDALVILTRVRVCGRVAFS